MNAQALAVMPTPAVSFSDMMQLAEAVAKSGMFGMKTREQAFVLMAIAQAEGRHPALAARDYDVIQGRPSKKAEAMLRDFLEGGGKVEWHALSDTIADATFSHSQGGSARIMWDLARANLAGLGAKENWKRYPRQMLRSRTVSEGVRTVWPMATLGLYVNEEVADMAPAHNGPTIDHEPVEAPRDHGAEEPAASQERAAINRDVPLRAAAAPMPRGARVAERAPRDPGAYEAPAKPTAERTDEQWQVWLDKLRTACAVLYHRDEVVEIGNRASVGDAISTGPEWVRAEISAILGENYTRFGAEEAPDADEDWPGEAPEIMGQEKVMSGDD